ncbi:hypothetical protein [Acutalibacter sp. 1XD8-33]|uniref:hypothetical protein n=1 Tax=Acutalibacter sp. 1XD8-33 TaxID=2320081 RepID=UPI001314F5BB|nr:hypothetical protein [Acutalibacter sp. 1XD8-33]
MGNSRLTSEQLQTLEMVLRHGDRVELVPVKGGVRLLRVRREEVKKAEEIPENP